MQSVIRPQRQQLPRTMFNLKYTRRAILRQHFYLLSFAYQYTNMADHRGPRWGDSAEVRCGWCKKRGRFIYNLDQYDDQLPYKNWKQLTHYEPSTIICNGCYDRGCSPYVNYLNIIGRNSFGIVGGNLELVAEFAFKVHAQYSREKLAKMTTDPSYNLSFPPSKRRSATEMGRRRPYGLEHVGQSIDIIYNWLMTTCPICDLDRPNNGCNHRKPSLLILGERGITVSFDDQSPNIRQVGLPHYCLHTGLRSLKERVLDLHNNKGPNLRFELDANSAWRAAGYADTEEPGALQFIRLRNAQRNRFPRRDIDFIEPAIDSRFVRILTEFYENNSVMDSPPLEPCINCGRPINMIGYNNRPLACTVCNKNLMCMGCANDGADEERDVLSPQCYPCKFNYSGPHTRGSYELAMSLENDIIRVRNYHNARRMREAANATQGTAMEIMSDDEL